MSEESTETEESNNKSDIFDSEPFDERSTSWEINEKIQIRSFQIIPIIGYGILITAIINILYIVFPTNFVSAAWELRAVGKLSETGWAILLGMTLSFIHINKGIPEKKILWLNYLSWVSFAIGILYFLLVPLAVRDTEQLYNQLKSDHVNQLKIQLDKFAQSGKIVDNMKKNNEVFIFAKTLGITLDVEKDSNMEKVKANMYIKLERHNGQSLNRIHDTYREMKINLLKDAFKWILSAIVTGIFFIIIWYYSKWARSMRKAVKYQKSLSEKF